MSARSVVVHPPTEAASRLGGISVATLIALLKANGYAYTSLSPNAKPWGRGRQLWGLTDAQIAAIAEGQARRHPSPGSGDVVPERTRALPGLAALGHDGKSRIRRPRRS
jgi:hypothetical protein